MRSVCLRFTWWLGWLCFAPLFAVAVGRPSIEALGLGLIAAVSAGIIQAGWHGQGLALFMAYYPFLLLSPILAAITETGSTFRKRATGLPWVGLVAAFGVTCEWLTKFLPMPVHIALSQYREPAVLQIASITGV